MRTFITGGAVRDEILGLPVKDRDHIVLDSNPEELMSLGFEKVGNNYDVFLHPKTKEEHVLAYENDLAKELERRDLTINSIAKDEGTGEIHDPFGGVRDIERKVLRHTSGHFQDDPIRLLRLARFKARMPSFSIATETLHMCAALSRNENLFAAIPGERILLEIKKVLQLSDPTEFFELLKDWGTLERFFPELSSLVGVEQNEKYHPEGDCWVHTMLVLKHACSLTPNPDQSFPVRFACLVHDLGKALTPKSELPSHKMHEHRGVKLVKQVCERFKTDSYTKKLALSVCKNHLKVHRAFDLKASTTLDLLTELNAFREGPLFEDVLICCLADSMGKETREYPQRDYLMKLASYLRRQSLSDLTEAYEGSKLGEMIRQKQIKEIKRLKTRISS